MQLGKIETNITPPIPIVLGGYADRKKPAKNVNKSLKARIIYLKSNDSEYVLISIDILLLNKNLIDDIKNRAFKLVNIPEKNILISCTHTHSGPATHYMHNLNLDLDYPDQVYIKWLEKTLAGSILRAKSNTEKVYLSHIADKIDDIGKNRHNPDSSIDNQLIILAFKNKNNKLKAVLFNYACHPTVLGSDNYSIHPDFPGEAIEKLNKLYPKTIFAFFNGSAGDVSTRFTRRKQTLKEAERLGNILAAKIFSLINKTDDFKEDINIMSKQIKLKVPIKSYPDQKKINKKIKESKNELDNLRKKNINNSALRIAKTKLEGAEIQKHLASLSEKLDDIAEINIWKIEKTILVTIPGELFSKLSLKLKKLFPDTKIMVFGYTNGYLGYIPSKSAYQEEIYESLSTPIKAGFGGEIIERSSMIIEKLLKKY